MHSIKFFIDVVRSREARGSPMFPPGDHGSSAAVCGDLVRQGDIGAAVDKGLDSSKTSGEESSINAKRKGFDAGKCGKVFVER